MTAQLPTTSTTPLALRTLHSPEPLPSVIYHLLALSLCLYTQNWVLQFAPLQFLIIMFTIWTGLIQLVYFTLYCTAALLSLLSAPAPATTTASSIVGWLRCTTSLLLSAMVLCTFGTALIFWSIYSYDPRLMVPEGVVYDIRLNRQSPHGHTTTGEVSKGWDCSGCCLTERVVVRLLCCCMCVLVMCSDLQHSVPLVLSLIELFTFPHPDMVSPAQRTSRMTRAAVRASVMVSVVYTHRIAINITRRSLSHCITLIDLCVQPRWLDFSATLLFPLLYLVLLFYLLHSHKLPYVFMQNFEAWHLVLFVSAMLGLAYVAYDAYSRVRAWRWKEAKQHNKTANGKYE